VCRLAAGTATVRTSRPKGDEDGDADDDDAKALAVVGSDFYYDVERSIFL
jgi:hypothetical protein